MFLILSAEHIGLEADWPAWGYEDGLDITANLWRDVSVGWQSRDWTRLDKTGPLHIHLHT